MKEKNRVVEELEGHVCVSITPSTHTHTANPLDFLHTHTTDRLNEVLFYYKRKWEGRERDDNQTERKEGPLEKFLLPARVE